jgi:hypothetical protein
MDFSFGRASAASATHELPLGDDALETLSHEEVAELWLSLAQEPVRDYEFGAMRRHVPRERR